MNLRKQFCRIGFHSFENWGYYENEKKQRALFLCRHCGIITAHDYDKKPDYKPEFPPKKDEFKERVLAILEEYLRIAKNDLSVEVGGPLIREGLLSSLPGKGEGRGGQ